MTPHRPDEVVRDAAPQVAMRPLGTPLPMGFLAQTVASSAFASLQLAWIPSSQAHAVALGVLLLAPPLQLLAAVMGFLSRDPVAGTGVGVLAGTWAGLCVVTLSSPPGSTSAGLGVLLLGAAVCLLVPAAAATAKVVPCLVILTSAARFAVTGVAELEGGRAWMTAAGWAGVALAVVALYGALALELEGARGRTVLPVGRSGRARLAVQGDLADQLGDLPHEPGVRQQL